MITLTEGKKNCPPKDLDPKNNICIVQELADGSKHWFYGSNLVTDDGDKYYAQQSAYTGAGSGQGSGVPSPNFFVCSAVLQNPSSADSNGSAQFKDDTFDYCTISFGIRNVSDISLALKETYRVLKPGGRFMCLEFSKIQNNLLNKLYKSYSRNIPKIGKIIVGDSTPYEYLVNSIENFYNQDELIDLMKKNNFYRTEFRNLSGGIVAIHSGWKI